MSSKDLYKQIEKLINDKIKPAIEMDGGDIELVEVSAEGVVRVRLLGACVGCALAPLTLHMGVEKEIKVAFPEIKIVELA